MTAAFNPRARRVRVAAEYIAMLAPFTSREETRYYLGGIHIAPHPQGGVVMAATDGHVLGVVHDADGHSNGDWICPAPAALVSACSRRMTTRKRRDDGLPADARPQVYFVGEAVHLTAAEIGEIDQAAEIGHRHRASMHAPPIDGTYPDWTRVLQQPALADCAAINAISFNPLLFDRFARVAAIRRVGKIFETRMIFGSTEADQVTIRVPAVPEFLGVVMPMRSSMDKDTRASRPDWLAALMDGKNAPASTAEAAA